LKKTNESNREGSDKTAIRPFHVNVPDAELTELRRRINATKWPERETVADASQGVQLATIQALARYWATDYDWRKIESKMNAVPQFITEIDGLDIHFIHVRSRHENALPVIVTHGWPGSVIEQMKIIDPLTNPTAHGGNASDAFHVVIPSMPGYGYSGKPTTTWVGCRPHRACLGRTDEASRVQPICGARRRLGRDRRRSNGRAGGSRIARHSHQHAWHLSSRHRPGSFFRSACAIGSLSR
jgi:pimeloyl-ACP methyl ester carboxylesterase